MKSLLRLLTALLFFLLFSHAYASDHKPKELFTQEELEYIYSSPVIKIGMISNFKPFSFIENKKHQGYTKDLLEKISYISGLNFDIYTEKWNVILKDFKENKTDMVSEISLTNERKKFALFTNPYYEIPTFIFGLKNDKNYKTIADLKGKNVGISYSIYYKDQLKQQGINVIEYVSSNEKAKALALGKIDYFLASYTSGKKAVIAQSITSIKPLDEFTGIKKEDLRFGIKKIDLMLYNIIKKSLNSIAIHEIDKLTNKWILELKELNIDVVNISNTEKNYLQNKKAINLCIDPRWMPFEKINEKGQIEGITKYILKEFAEKINTPIQLIKTNSWSQSIKEFKNKECDLLSMVVKTKDREKIMNFTESYINTPLVLSTKNSTPFIINIRDLKNKKVGIVKNYSYSEILKNKYKNLDFVEIDSIDKGLEKVEKSELFGVIDALPVIAYKIQKDYPAELKIGSKFDEKLYIHMAVQKDNRLLQNILNKLINNLSESKKQELLNKHISVKYEEKVDYKLFWETFILVLLVFSFLIYRQYVQRKNNLKLTESYNKMQTILDATMEGIIISKDGVIQDVNQGALSLFDYQTKKQLQNKELSDLIDMSSQTILFEKLQLSFTEPYEVLLLKSDDKTFPALVRGKSIDTKEGKLRVSTIIDLSDIKEKEALILQQSKISTTGEMLENISHQWRQPLSQISTISTGIKVQKEFGFFDESTLITQMNNINNSAQYLSQTIEDFKNFLKPNVDAIKDVDLVDTLNKVNQLVRDSFEYNNIKIIIETKPCTVTQNENLIIQALINILNNSKDAILENNDIQQEESYVFLTLYKDKHNAYIVIKDNGQGIKEDILNKIFEPYFTTKHESVGTGIGLYMTYQIIHKQLEGSIKAKNIQYSYKDKTHSGAQFVITIPLNT
ncbi:transporter substrate-binding domain-containing protein [Poseidonibacter lekithochrous]|uniref:transporter substrate-binding domain-containing protein n=1 Tax=Poseidonibacter lekithochrous TaxID=1904463 RepID=UPI0008FC9342|nr:transporter substrate-binding domain-containing protein [Poseidonibacter lekithochrous]QKJ22578.1 BvgS-like domain-containing signal transduction sensor histidine kinase (PAS domain) [Poseidonibacter lekithochrous]